MRRPRGCPRVASCAAGHAPAATRGGATCDAGLGGGARRRAARRELSVLLVGPARSRALNARYRGRDHATNVLSFPAPARRRAGAAAGRPGDLPGGAARARRARSKDARAHWAHLVVHGVLHLLGYDHERDDQARAWSGARSRVLRTLGSPIPTGAARRASIAWLARSCRATMAKDNSGQHRQRLSGPLARAHHAHAGRRPEGSRAAGRMLREAQQRGVLDADAFAMLEGVLRGGRPAGARHHGAAAADGVRAARRSDRAHPAGGHRIRPLALSGARRRSRRRGRHPAGQGPAAADRRRHEPSSTCASSCGRWCSCRSPSASTCC
jgi:probable rRNA maturation factor